MKKKETKKTFNENLNRLEEISRKLEEDNLDLEIAIELYEEGVELSKICIELLKSAEVKITELKTKLNNVLEISDEDI
ncbi:MAG: exodeoxyribonuclease VII small subunit [Ignavibacteria bacterium]|nr:exodeoxyribonuclease VII small subunit [Ignavibacteria bacterium]MDP3830614.1 exodeoxyribonuclease VII small subunit [Ignavibacteriaceae bacterium]